MYVCLLDGRSGLGGIVWEERNGWVLFERGWIIFGGFGRGVDRTRTRRCAWMMGEGLLLDVWQWGELILYFDCAVSLVSMIRPVSCDS
jgi:hypothetical protein